MAIQTRTLNAAEHDWYVTRSGLVARAALSEHRAKYYSDKGFGSNASIHKPLDQMEYEWLKSLTGVTANEYADMWSEAVSGQGFTPGQSLNYNKFIFYTSVTASP